MPDSRCLRSIVFCFRKVLMSLERKIRGDPTANDASVLCAENHYYWLLAAMGDRGHCLRSHPWFQRNVLFECTVFEHKYVVSVFWNWQKRPVTEGLPEAMSIETHQRVAYHLSKASVIFQEQVSLVGRLLFIVSPAPPKKGLTSWEKEILKDLTMFRKPW